MPDRADTSYLLDWVRDLGMTYPFFDFHVHPYDVFTGDVSYQPDNLTEGLFFKGTSNYHSPVIDGRLELDAGLPLVGPGIQRAFLLASRLAYTHTGSKVFTDHLDQARLSGALLLPVARVAGAAEEMLEASDRMFFLDDRLLPGCAFPIGIPAESLAGFFRLARKKTKIRAIKLHPNLAGLDPLQKSGHDLIEATLESAGSLNLPVVVHGGRTLKIEPDDAGEYGTLPRLATINWSLSSAPVILAHAGCFALTEDEAIAALRILINLFEEHPNLMADTSNLEPLVLRLVLERVDRQRLVFGSDALYVPIWKAWLRFIRALRQVSHEAEDDLIRIASLNPMYCLNPTRDVFTNIGASK
jgi:predicted TIM-barrel fold metal-dependent hydrolase